MNSSNQQHHQSSPTTPPPSVQTPRIRPYHFQKQTPTLSIPISPVPAFTTEDVERAYAQGVADTEQQLAQRVETEIAPLRQLLTSAVAAMEQARVLWMTETEEQIITITLAIATRIIGTHAQHYKASICDQAQAALATIRDTSSIRLHLHPDDVSTMSSKKTDLTSALPSAPTLDLIPDPAVIPGGCVIETETQLIDARLDAQLRRIGECLRDAMHRQQEPGP